MGPSSDSGRPKERRQVEMITFSGSDWVFLTGVFAQQQMLPDVHDHRYLSSRYKNVASSQCLLVFTPPNLNV